MKRIILCSIAISLIGCASSSFVQKSDTEYAVTCKNWKVACDSKSDDLCGKGNYKVWKDTTLQCMSIPQGGQNCTWQYEIECKK